MHGDGYVVRSVNVRYDDALFALDNKVPPGSFSHSPMPWHSGGALTITGILAKLCMCCTCFAPVAMHVRYALQRHIVSYVSSYARACPGVSGLGFE
ncbi:hypothetical protein ISKNV_00039 [Infectious spleen and kidney necrosis virus]|nr:hypothetical protein ISKNV_00039 [Infectious spleen and kidney necrosis virus]